MQHTGPKTHYRSVFISDLHLGTRGCRSDFLIDFLRRTDCDHLYLVGDVVDGWRLKKSWYWHEEFDTVVRMILDKAEAGTRVTYIPGNHDEVFRQWLGLEVAGVKLMREAVHEAADGRKYLIIHGDEFDGVIRYAKFLALLGDWAYDFAIWLNRGIARVRRAMGLPYWSFSAWSKQKVKRAVNFISAFEQAVAADARRNNVDIVLCGHIHRPAVQQMDDILYINTGDWVESNSAVVEHPDGRLELIRWTDASHAVLAPRRPAMQLPAAA